jgi:phosphoribosylglycinamide formyltransferase-1
MMSGLVVLISGRGSNLRALVAANLPVSAVISNRSDAPGLEFARARGIAAEVLDQNTFASRASFDERLAERVDSFAPAGVLLAGFMRILGDRFVKRYHGRLINIHPSLLPAFPGLRTHARAIATGAKVHGATVHFVTPALDQGPIILQAAVPVLASDDEAMLAARVLAQEHRIYPVAARWLLEGWLSVSDGRVAVRGHPPQWVFAS